MSRVRIVGGQWRSRLLDVTAVPGLRPTPDRVRETLFNWLSQDLDGQACVDLFAGTGILGFEAASRGESSDNSRPPMRTEPPYGRSQRNTRPSVDLPQATGPAMPKISPGWAVRLRPEKTGSSP